MNSCRRCGVSTKNDHFCSRACQYAYHHESTVGKRLRVCESCGKTFTMRHMSGKAYRGETKEGRFCSKACKSRWHVENAKPKASDVSCKVYFKECNFCGRNFTDKKKSGRFCSSGCLRDYTNARLRDEYVAVKPKLMVCVVCNNSFESAKPRVTCSIGCQNKNYRINKQTSNRKRARHFNVEYQPIKPLKVFDRDGWHCQICGKHTPKNNRGKRYPNSPELDHRIPLSMGGGHTYSNVQCACRKCNGSKSNNDCRGQMPLFSIK